MRIHAFSRGDNQTAGTLRPGRKFKESSAGANRCRNKSALVTERWTWLAVYIIDFLYFSHMKETSLPLPTSFSTMGSLVRTLVIVFCVSLSIVPVEAAARLSIIVGRGSYLSFKHNRTFRAAPVKKMRRSKLGRSPKLRGLNAHWVRSHPMSAQTVPIACVKKSRKAHLLHRVPRFYLSSLLARFRRFSPSLRSGFLAQAGSAHGSA